MKLLSVLVAVATIGSVHAYFRMECPGRTGLARMDPIVSPGGFSSHAHAVHGSSGFSQTSHTKDLLAGSCTSCLVKQDKSAYWHPPLYFEDASTGEYELVKQGILSVYYKYDINRGYKYTAFPQDFRMVSGDTFRRKYTAGNYKERDPPPSQWKALGQDTQEILAQRAIGFSCLNQNMESALTRHYLPDKAYLDANCSWGLRTEVAFPQCWNGKDLDSKNHADHVAFPTANGECPKGFGVLFPKMWYEVIWDTNAFAKRRGRFVLSNGDVTGFGYHGDFLMGWNTTLLQTVIETCDGESAGSIKNCPLFDLVSYDEATRCAFKVPQSLANEDVKGPFKLLPGGIKAEK